ncbi:MAG TPA: DUF3084 domain-containing protein [Oceanithermus profundus]|uniref:DUF3084 domain-containing protein n=1 Tax=Oceanithermus profundus TaxID=187137 RepID=A0A7C4ZEH5_9DEIN|nr:DUF3084 domain-containing protein [Oceanithermus profundus]
MSLWSLLFGLLLIAALVAYAGDVVGRRVGRLHLRLFGLRPRTTALLVAVFTGVVIALLAFAAFFFLATDARKTILEAEKVRQERDLLRGEVMRLGAHVNDLEARAARALGESERLERELRAKVEALKLAESEIKRLEGEKELLKQAVEEARAQLESREVELAKVRADVERITAERSALEAEFDALQQGQVLLLEELEKLREAEAEALQRAETAQAETQKAEAAASQALARVQEIQKEIAALEKERQKLLGNIATLDAERKALEQQRDNLLQANRRLQDQLAAANQEVLSLNQELVQLAQQRSASERGLELLRKQLSETLKDTVLAEVVWPAGDLQPVLGQVVHLAEVQVRVEGFRGVLVPEDLSSDTWKPPGILQARSAGVAPDGKVLLQLHFVPKERKFRIGQVLAVRELPPPRYQPERVRRGLESLRESALERLLKAGVLPERVAAAGLSGAVLADFQGQIEDEVHNLVVAVVAADDVWTTETPQLLYQVLFAP